MTGNATHFDEQPSCAGDRPPNGFPAKLQRQGPRAEAERNAGCTFAPRSAAREDCQAACRLPNFGCIRGFSPGTKPGAANFSGELGGGPEIRFRLSAYTGPNRARDCKSSNATLLAVL